MGNIIKRIPTKWESKRYLAIIGDMLDSIRPFLAEKLFNVMASTEEDLTEYIGWLFLSSYSKNDNGVNGENSPILGNNAMTANLGSKWLSEHRFPKDIRYVSNERRKELWKIRVGKFQSNEEKLTYYHEVLRNYTDVAAVFRIIEFAFYRQNRGNFETPQWNGFFKKLDEFLVAGETHKTIKDRATECRKLRIDNAHLTDDILSKYDYSKTVSDLDTINGLLQAFDPLKDSQECKKLRSDFFLFYDSWKKRIVCEPMSIEVLERIPGYDGRRFLKSDEYEGRFDSESNILFFTQREEIENKFKYYIYLNEARCRMPTEGATSYIPKEIGVPRGVALDDFPSLLSYRCGNPLTQDQFLEVARHSTILVDAKSWKDKGCRDTLSNKICTLGKDRGFRISVDWDTRVELFAAEKNIGGSFLEEDQTQAHKAHIMMNFLHNDGSIRYLAKTSTPLTSQERLLKIVLDEPDNLFAVITHDKGFCELMQRHGVTNVLPIFVTSVNGSPPMGCVIRTYAEPMLKTFLGLGDTNKSDVFECKDSSISPDVMADQIANPVPSASRGEKVFYLGTRQRDEMVQANPLKPSPVAAQIHKPEICIFDNKEMLPIEHLPCEGDYVFTSDGKQLQLTQKLGTGGEGIVYATMDPNIVVKVYHANQMTVVKRDKLELMASNQPEGIHELCWPRAVVYNEYSEFCGYVMPSAAGFEELGTSVLMLGDNEVAERMKGWNRLSLVSLCIELCRVFGLMHRRGILMGDVNPRNIMVRTDSPQNIQVMLVDCDSYQFGRYPCPVGTTVFTSPGIYERHGNNPNFSTFLRTEDDESYALASLLFHILMLNQPPYAGKGMTDTLQAIRNYNFAYRLAGDSENTGSDTPDGPSRLIWNNTLKDVRETFGQVFKYGKTITLTEWRTVLSRYRSGINSGLYTTELKPIRYWDTPDRKYNIDFDCADCGNSDFNMPRGRYEYEEKKHLPHLCNDCRSAAEELKRESAIMRCEYCGASYETNGYMKYLIEYGYRRSKCPECMALVKFNCYNCGKLTQTSNAQYKNDETHYTPHFCKECGDMMRRLRKQPATLTCVTCGKTYDADGYKVYLVQKGRRVARCQECAAKKRQYYNK